MQLTVGVGCLHFLVWLLHHIGRLLLLPRACPLLALAQPLWGRWRQCVGIGVCWRRRRLVETRLLVPRRLWWPPVWGCGACGCPPTGVLCVLGWPSRGVCPAARIQDGLRRPWGGMPPGRRLLLLVAGPLLAGGLVLCLVLWLGVELGAGRRLPLLLRPRALLWRGRALLRLLGCQRSLQLGRPRLLQRSTPG